MRCISATRRNTKPDMSRNYRVFRFPLASVVLGEALAWIGKVPALWFAAFNALCTDAYQVGEYINL